MTFIWTNGGHNVNYIGQGPSAASQYTNCAASPTPINTQSEAGPYTQKLTTRGSHYFFCGVGSGGHCLAGMKAKITVVDDLIDCDD